MPAMNVLFVSHSPGLGGAERVMLETVEVLERREFSPFVVVPEEGPLAKAVRALGIPVYIVHAPWWLPYSFQKAHFRYYLEEWPAFVEPIGRIIREREIDLVYSCSGLILHGALAALMDGVPHLQHMQDLLRSPYLGLRMPLGSPRVAYRILGLLSSLVVSVGRTVQDDIGRDVPARKCQVVPLGCKSVGSSPGTIDLPRSGPSTVRVGIVGAVQHNKGVGVMPEIVRRVCAERPDVHFYWAGPGTDRLIQDIGARARLDGVSHLDFLGYREDIPAFLNSVDFLLHPSRSEAFPRAVLEGAAAGRAVVATSCGGTRELVQHGVTGFLTPVDDAETLAAAVLRLARDPELRQRMGVDASRLAQGFSFARFRAGMRDALLEAHSRGPVLRGRAARAIVTSLLRLPAVASPVLRRAGVYRAVRAFSLRARTRQPSASRSVR